MKEYTFDRLYFNQRLTNFGEFLPACDINLANKCSTTWVDFKFIMVCSHFSTFKRSNMTVSLGLSVLNLSIPLDGHTESISNRKGVQQPLRILGNDQAVPKTHCSFSSNKPRRRRKSSKRQKSIHTKHMRHRYLIQDALKGTCIVSRLFFIVTLITQNCTP